jgi:hypothetical protein
MSQPLYFLGRQILPYVVSFGLVAQKQGATRRVPSYVDHGPTWSCKWHRWHLLKPCIAKPSTPMLYYNTRSANSTLKGLEASFVGCLAAVRGPWATDFRQNVALRLCWRH